MAIVYRTFWDLHCNDQLFSYNVGIISLSIYIHTHTHTHIYNETKCVELQVRRLEAQGLTPKQAEAITAVITEVLNDSLENVAQSFTSKTEMQRV